MATIPKQKPERKAWQFSRNKTAQDPETLYRHLGKAHPYTQMPLLDWWVEPTCQCPSRKMQATTEWLPWVGEPAAALEELIWV